MELHELADRSVDFHRDLIHRKSLAPSVSWYLYNSLANFHLLNENFKGEGRNCFHGLASGMKIADIGAADGDTSFFLESLGAEVTIVENPSTNANYCLGISTMKASLSSQVETVLADLDWTPHLRGGYDLAVFLGILYHLRNPILVLNTIAHAAQRMVVSTATFKQFEGRDVSETDMSRLLANRQVNNDPTNYWMFTPKSFRTVLNRSGWTVLDEFTIPDPAFDAYRSFCYCERVSNWQDTRKHHDF